MSYIDTHLSENETLLYQANIHWAVCIPGVFWAVIALTYTFLLRGIANLGVGESFAPVVFALLFFITAKLMKRKLDSLFALAFIFWSLYAFFIHWAFFGYWSVLGMLQTHGWVIPASLSGLNLLSGLAEKFSSELTLTSQRVIAKFGFIRRQTFELSLTHIEGIEINQSILGRLLNYGAIRVMGSGGTFTSLYGIADPLTWREAINKEIGKIP